MGRHKTDWSVLQQLAESYNGEILSSPEEYQDSHTKLRWRCAFGHEFRNALNNIKDHGQWCPECNRNLSAEDRVRFALSHLMGKPFVKTRDVLGEGLELDGYCAELNLAFEFQGPQHYQFNSRFHASQEAFLAQIERDKRKATLAKQKGITLLIIDWKAGVSNETLVRMVCKTLAAAQIRPLHTAKDIPWEEFHRDHAYAPEMERYAQEHGGHFLGPYVDMHTPAKWICREGHAFTKRPNDVKYLSSWCPTCRRGGKKQ